MHIHLTPENERFVSERMQELQCSGSDYVNSLVTAIIESGYTREYVIQLTKKDEPNKKVKKKIIMRRSSTLRYSPTEF